VWGIAKKHKKQFLEKKGTGKGGYGGSLAGRENKKQETKVTKKLQSLRYFVKIF
jgi:hypothetical protein